MYRVKLNNENSEKITVGGIDITHRWKQINEKTKALEEIEKKGIIKIEEISKATWQGIEATEVRLGIYKENVNGMLAVNPIENEARGLLVNPPGNEIRGLAVNPIENEARGLLLNPPGNEIGEFTISTNVNFIGGQIGISQAMNELNGIKVDFGVLASSLETKQGTCIIEQKPISTEPTERGKTINDLEERISDVTSKLPKIIEKTVNEMVEKKLEEINKKSNTNKEDREKNIAEKFEPKTEAKKSEIEKIHWQGTVEELIYLFKNLYGRGLLKQKKCNKLISDHFLKKCGTDITANAISTTYQKMKDNYPIIDEVLNNLNNFGKNYKG